MKGKVISDKKSIKNALTIYIHGEVWTINGDSINIDTVTERIKQGYLEHGTQLFEKLDGCFTIVIEDYNNGLFYLVRDKLGIQPVYYSFQHGILAWGNTMKDVILQGGFAVNANINVLHNYLAFRYICGRNTIYKDVFELLPAHYLKFNLDSEGIEEKAYWHIPNQDVGNILSNNENDVINKIEEIFISNIRRSLGNSKCRYGILSSGGVDSSLIVAIAAKHVRGDLPTFFIGFDNYDGDRSKDAKMVADLYGAKHSNFYVDSKQYADSLIEAIRIHEEPLNHPGNVGVVLFYKQMKGKLDAVLLGEGVDTVFCGSKTYPLLKYCYIFNPFRNITKKMFSLISKDIIPSSYRRYFYKIKDAFVMDPEEYMIQTFAECDYKDASDMLQSHSDMDYINYYKEFVTNCNRDNALEKFLMINEHSFLVEGLNSGAKFGPANCIVNHYPFVDVDLLTYSNRIPFGLKTRRFTGKYIIKRLAERYFPKSFIYQRKEGFGVPLKTYFGDQNSMERYYSILTDQRTKERGIFNKSELYRLVDNYKAGDMPAESYESLLWTTINLELWYRIHIDKTL